MRGVEEAWLEFERELRSGGIVTVLIEYDIVEVVVVTVVMWLTPPDTGLA